ncbi:MAG: Hpt domain-containing protein [Bacteroidetes bacterium]|nr:Hpt domain-containing protein [Bacteroidota bacterium]
MNYRIMEEVKKPYSIEKLSQYVGGDPKQIDEMIVLFLDTVPPEIIQLSQLTKQEKWPEVYKLAHRIKPSFEVFAMDDILEDIKKIEHLARENNVEGSLSYYIQQLSNKFLGVTKLLKQEL